MQNRPKRKVAAAYDYTMKKTLKASRGTEIDSRVCADRVGGNQFELVIIAAQRARELAKKNKNSPTYVKGAVEALLEIQEGLIGRDYVYKDLK